MQKWYGKDIFVMRRNLQSASVQPGMAVCFNVAQGPKGPHAVNLKPFDLPAPDQEFVGTVKSFNDSKVVHSCFYHNCQLPDQFGEHTHSMHMSKLQPYTRRVRHTRRHRPGDPDR